jgi:hypothetical protein
MYIPDILAEYSVDVCDAHEALHESQMEVFEKIFDDKGWMGEWF